MSAVFENLQDMGVDELIEEFVVTREQVEAVLQFTAARSKRKQRLIVDLKDRQERKGQSSK